MNSRSAVSNACVALGIGLITAIASALPANAFTYTFGADSDSSNSTATGAAATVEFNFLDLGNDKVQIDLLITNTTGENSFGAGATTSKLTGFAFDMFEGLSLESSSLGDNLDTLLTNVRFTPFTNTVGNFDFGLADNGNFTGGNANSALAQGNSNNASFVFSGLNGETVNAFQDRFAAAVESGEINVATRFQQVNAGAGSDKLLGGSLIRTVLEPPVVSAETPEPLSLIGLGVAASGMLLLAKRKREENQELRLVC